MSGLNYERRRVEKTNFLYWKNMKENELMWPNPIKYVKYNEKEMQGPKGKFTAKNFIFECVETGQSIGIPHSGLLNYQLQEYRKGDVLEIEYNGRDAEDRHQTTIIELALTDDEIDPSHVKSVQDKVEAAQDDDGEDDDLV